MPGLEEWQWKAVEDGLEKISDLGCAINQINVKLTEMDVAMFGIDGANGLRSIIKKNTKRIDALEKKPEEDKKEKSKVRFILAGWIITILLFGTDKLLTFLGII